MHSTTILQMVLIALFGNFFLSYGKIISFTKVMIQYLYYLVKLTSYWDFSSQNYVMDRES